MIMLAAAIAFALTLIALSHGVKLLQYSGVTAKQVTRLTKFFSYFIILATSLMAILIIACSIKMGKDWRRYSAYDMRNGNYMEQLQRKIMKAFEPEAPVVPGQPAP